MTDSQDIPLHLFQTYHTLELPPRMQQSVNRLKRMNPELKHHLYDDAMCREFIKTHFPLNVVCAFDKLVPGAYKADLWRYCVLYIHGGIYLDIKYGCVDGFKLADLINQPRIVKDREMLGVCGIYQALMIHKPHDIFLHNCIENVVANVHNGYYGKNALMVTGPHMAMNHVPRNVIETSELELSENKRCILRKGQPILRIYKGYRSELAQTQLCPPYYTMWERRQIYR